MARLEVKNINKIPLYIVINNPGNILNIGMSLDLTVSAYFEDGVVNSAYSDVIWTSSNPKIIKVDSSGKITALGMGKATITVLDKKDKNVLNNLTFEVGKLSDLIISVNKMSLALGDSATASAQGMFITYSGMIKSNYKDVIWSSSNPELLQIDKNGLISVATNKEYYWGEYVLIKATDKYNPMIFSIYCIYISKKEPTSVDLIDNRNSRNANNYLLMLNDAS